MPNLWRQAQTVAASFVLNNCQHGNQIADVALQGGKLVNTPTKLDDGIAEVTVAHNAHAVLIAFIRALDMLMIYLLRALDRARFFAVMCRKDEFKAFEEAYGRWCAKPGKRPLMQITCVEIY